MLAQAKLKQKQAAWGPGVVDYLSKQVVAINSEADALLATFVSLQADFESADTGDAGDVVTIELKAETAEVSTLCVVYGLDRTCIGNDDDDDMHNMLEVC